MCAANSAALIVTVHESEARRRRACCLLGAHLLRITASAGSGPAWRCCGRWRGSASAGAPGLSVRERGVLVSELSITSLQICSVKTTPSGSHSLELRILHGLSVRCKCYQELASYFVIDLKDH